MTYDDYQIERIRKLLNDKKIQFEEKKMMGRLCIMVDDKMLCGAMIDKETGHDLLMARIGHDYYEEALKINGARPMNFTGRPIKGFVFVDPIGFDNEDDLQFWLERCLAFNPFAKSSKKK